MEGIDEILGAVPAPAANHASIDPSFSGATFIQLWQMASANEQREWLLAMHRNIHLLQVQPGFQSMSLHPSLDGHNVVVYAQWDSQRDLIAAVERPEVKAARNELDSHGEPEGANYSVDYVTVPRDSQSKSVKIDPGGPHVTMVNLWTVADRDNQHALLSAMKSDAAAITSKRGFRAMAFHRSDDAKLVAVYAQWDSLGDFNRGIADNPAAMASREKLAQFGQASANTYTVDSVNLPIAGNETEFARKCR